MAANSSYFNNELTDPYFDISGGLLFYYYLSEGISVSTELPFGVVFFNPKDKNGNLMPNNYSGVYSKHALMFNPQLNINIWLSPTISMDLSSRLVLPFTDYLDDFNAFSWDSYASAKIGFSFFLTKSYDADQDGIADDYDFDIHTPPDEVELIDQFGRGPSNRDSDNDGVTDKYDMCPTTPVDERFLVDTLTGCGPSERDTDKDGVNDNLDKCPDTRRNEKVDINGCALYQRDSDFDGIYDDKDKCLNTPYFDHLQVDSSGCGKSERDTDNDGIVDLYDECKDNLEDYNYFTDNDGCADTVEYDITLKLNELKPLFEDSTSTLTKTGENILHAQPLSIIQYYPTAIWTLEVKSPFAAEIKSKKIKNFIDELTKDSTRTNIKFSKSNDEEIFMYLDKETAKKIAIENQNIYLLNKKEEK
ncbi:MAG: thrombospondin type 3 repeat-containing protein [Ignavibacteriaceae bacterium]|nr:thrombospondin type 3 repeat-containing protein [Ignavibacteriaceae bacterium]